MNETPKRIISGFLVAFIYALFFNIELWNFLPLYLFICGVCVIVLSEFYSMYLREKSDSFNKKTGILFAFLIVTIFYLQSLVVYRRHHDLGWAGLNRILDFVPNDPVVFYGLFIGLILVLGIYNILTARLSGSIYSMSIVIFGVFYIPLTISFIFLLRSQPEGVFFVWLVSFITAMTDIGGYLFGKLYGRHRFSLPVSPKKTWEGYIGAFILQLLLSIVFNAAAQKFFDVQGFRTSQMILISVIIYFAAIFGDLFESLIKRNADAKDSGSFIPGHGGLFDRVDSMMLSLPVFYFIVTSAA